MAAKKAKNKQKGQPKKLSLRDRLARHWEAGKWAAFVDLYLRDRAASELTPWAARYLDGLYNCLTQAFFVDRDPAAGLEIAHLILEEDPERTGAAMARDCTRVALDFLNMRADGEARPSPLAEEEALPEPWRTLRAGLAAAESPRKRGRKKKSDLPDSPAGHLAQKLAKQFTALPRAANLRVYTSFLQTAEALEKETASLPGAANFKALRLIAELLRELGGPKRGGDSLRDLADLGDHQLILRIPRGADHPAVLGLWNFFCEQGGKKFGSYWQAAARALRLKFDRSQPDLAEAFQTLFSLGEFALQTIRLHAVYEKYGAWSEPERYILGTAFCSALHEDGPGILNSLPGGILLKYFKDLTTLGRQWRPANPWSRPVQHFFELMARSQGLDFFRALDFDYPYESLTVPTLVFMALISPKLAGMVAVEAAARLPLKLDEEQIDLVALDLTFRSPVPDRAAALEVKKLLEPDSFAQLLTAWIKAAAESSAHEVLERQGQNLAWDRLSPSLLAFIEENLPAEEPARLFCRLCLGRERRSLSNDPKELAAFIRALARAQDLAPKPLTRFEDMLEEPEETGDGFAANLFLMLTTWPQVGSDFLADLFHLAQPHLFDQGEELLWVKAVEAVGQIKKADRRKALARDLAADLKNAADPARREALRCFNSIEKGGRARPNVNKFLNPMQLLMRDLGRNLEDDEFDYDFDDELMKRFQQMMGRGGGRKKS